MHTCEDLCAPSSADCTITQCLSERVPLLPARVQSRKTKGLDGGERDAEAIDKMQSQSNLDSKF